LILLAAVAQEHVLVIGPPGTAKSVAVIAWRRPLAGATLNIFSAVHEPNEYRPVDLRKLKEGLVETRPPACCRGRNRFSG